MIIAFLKFLLRLINFLKHSKKASSAEEKITQHRLLPTPQETPKWRHATYYELEKEV